ncbi:MAG: hypothetical protein H7039_21930 [Bryobacteraceae bacterium]|nr:hypothetical protein [Bryobacteraceae bacterium]
MTRRGFFAFAVLHVAAHVVALTAWADDRTDALDVVTPLATALANSDPDGFAQSLPRDLENRAEIRANVAALIAQAEVTSSVEVLSASKGEAELDWYMEIRSRATAMVVERRRGTVRIKWKKTRLVALEPSSYFAPPKAADPVR